jgi:hypothetical protein
MKTVSVLVAAAAMAASAPAMAQYFEGFEHGDWSGNWTHLSSTTTPHTLNADAARTGSFGAVMDGGGWWKQNEAVVNDGDTFEYYFRGSGGRAYIGFTSDDIATEAYTILAAPNTSNVVIQRNSGFTFADLAASTAIAWSATEFYRVAVSYSGGIITAQAFDSGGAPLADAIMADTGYSGGGSLFLRGFGGGHVDDISIVPAPASLALLAFGGLAAARRRR